MSGLVRLLCLFADVNLIHVAASETWDKLPSPIVGRRLTTPFRLCNARETADPGLKRAAFKYCFERDL